MASPTEDQIKNTSALRIEWKYFFIINKGSNSNSIENIFNIIQKEQECVGVFHYKKISMFLKITFVTQE
jgi:hypothetical protein